MKTLSDGSLVSLRSYYFLLDWNDSDEKKYMTKHFQKDRLCELTIQEYQKLWFHAAYAELKHLIKATI